MHRIVALSMLLVFSAAASVGQLRSQEQRQTSVASSLVRPVPAISGFLDWFTPENFRMSHRFSLEYLSAGGTGLSLATYTNTMLYRISTPLDVRFDVSMQGSPFGSGLGQGSDFTRVYLSRAEMNYRPWQNVHIQFQYRQFPYGWYNAYDPWYYRTPATAPGDE